MADKLIGGLFARARKAKERRYVASTRDVGRLMRLFHDTIAALDEARKSKRDGFAVVDEAVGWAKLLRVQGEVTELANLADEDPLHGAADRYLTLRKFAPDLIEALEFKAVRSNDPTLSALRLLQDLNRSGLAVGGRRLVFQLHEGLGEFVDAVKPAIAAPGGVARDEIEIASRVRGGALAAHPIRLRHFPR